LILGCGAFRFHLLLPILLIYCLWRKWKFVAGVAVTAGVMAVVSIVLIGLNESVEYVRIAAQSTDVAVSTRTNFLAFLHVVGLRGSFVVILWLFTAAMTLSVLSRKKPSLATAVLAIPVLSYHLQPYDLSMLILPIALSLSAGALAQFVVAACGIFPGLAFLASLPTLRMITEAPTCPHPRNSKPISSDRIVPSEA